MEGIGNEIRGGKSDGVTTVELRPEGLPTKKNKKKVRLTKTAKEKVST